MVTQNHIHTLRKIKSSLQRTFKIRISGQNKIRGGWKSTSMYKDTSGPCTA